MPNVVKEFEGWVLLEMDCRYILVRDGNKDVQYPQNWYSHPETMLRNLIRSRDTSDLPPDLSFYLSSIIGEERATAIILSELS